MARGDRYTPRLSIDVSEELRNKIQTHIPWGTMRPLMTILLESVIAFIEKTGVEHRSLIIGAIVSGKISILDILKKGED